MSAATASPSFASTSATTTLAPSSANSLASASPIPWPAPVTIATLSLSLMLPPTSRGTDHPVQRDETQILGLSHLRTCNTAAERTFPGARRDDESRPNQHRQNRIGCAHATN